MAAQPEARSTDGETRRQIMLLLLKHSPLSASDIGDHLGLSAAGVRRHLDNLVEDELAEIIPTRPHPGGGRGRGRPAKSFRLTDKGRAHFGHDYDSLAALAITALRDAGGDEAVRQFARDRIAAILEDVVPAGSTEESIEATARALMDAFSAHGYATKSASIIAQSRTLLPNFRNCVRLNMKQLRSYWDNMCSRSPPSLMDTASAPPTSHQKISL